MICQFCWRFHRKNDDFTIVAKGITMFKLMRFGVQSMEAILISMRLNVGTESTEFWPMRNGRQRTRTGSHLIYEWTVLDICLITRHIRFFPLFILYGSTVVLYVRLLYIRWSVTYVCIHVFRSSFVLDLAQPSGCFPAKKIQRTKNPEKQT